MNTIFTDDVEDTKSEMVVQIQRIACDICDRSFENITERNAHIENHFQQIECSNCQRTFTGDRAFEYHISNGKCKESVDVNRFRCHLCNEKMFDSICILNSHLENEHRCIITDQQLVCLSCDRNFAKLRYLKKHLREVHEKATPFSCDICGKEFNRKSNLTEHLLIHENKYLATCPTCKKSYRTQSALKLHLRMHTKEKPYKCDICNEKSYAYNTDLKRHKRSAHGILGKPFPCEYCSKVFYEPKLVKNHLKRQHKIFTT